MIDASRLDRLAAAANAADAVTALPGSVPWHTTHTLARDTGGRMRDADAVFIETADPATILALVESVQAARGREERAAERLAQASATNDELARKVQAVRDLHEPTEPLSNGYRACKGCYGPDGEWAAYPCATIRTPDGDAS